MFNASFLKRREIAVRFLKTSKRSEIAASFLKASKNALNDGGLTLETETSAFVHGGNSTFINSFDKTKLL